MSRGYSNGRDSDCKVYVGDLPNDARKDELEKAFSRYGGLRSVWVARNPPGFAFIEFEDSRDAEDAIAELDGRNICGRKVKVEMASGRRRGGGGGRGRSFGGGGYGGGGGGGYRRGPPRDIRNETCYSCGETGHFARDCTNGGGRSGGGGQRSYGGGGGGGSRYGGRSYNRGRSRSRSRSRSQSPKRNYRESKSRSPSPRD